MRRAVLQEKAARTFIKKGTGTIVLPTGVGKTRVACNIIKQLYDYGRVRSVLVVTPTTVLKETSWPANIEELGLDKIKDLKIHIECKHTAYKITEPYDLIIVDEVHTCLSPVHKQCLLIEHKYLLGLTASPPEHNLPLIEVYNEFIPTIYKASLKDCILWKICPPYRMYNLPVKLSKKERMSYSKWNGVYERAKLEILQYIKASQSDENMFDLATKSIKNSSSPLYKPAQMFYVGMTKRKEVVYNCDLKMRTCVSIIENHLDKKWIVFSKRIKSIEQVSESLTLKGIKHVMYHSKMKPINKAISLELIKNPEYKVILTAEALNAGYDLPELNGAISIAGVATDLIGIQTLGRINRIIEGKIPIFINLYCDDTQETIWVLSRTSSTPSVWITDSTQINYGE